MSTCQSASLPNLLETTHGRLLLLLLICKGMMCECTGYIGHNSYRIHTDTYASWKFTLKATKKSKNTNLMDSLKTNNFIYNNLQCNSIYQFMNFFFEWLIDTILKSHSFFCIFEKTLQIQMCAGIWIDKVPKKFKLKKVFLIEKFDYQLFLVYITSCKEENALNSIIIMIVFVLTKEKWMKCWNQCTIQFIQLLLDIFIFAMFYESSAKIFILFFHLSTDTEISTLTILY